MPDVGTQEPSGGRFVYLACLSAENFRIFGPAPKQGGDTDTRLRMGFGPATNVLVGENGSGKTAVIDAIRLCLQTTAGDYYRITADDFHIRNGHRADSFTLTCGFKDLTPQEQAVFLELLTTEEDGRSSLYVTVRAQLIDPLHSSRVSLVTRTGPDGQGPTLDGTARELLKATYLRPLRDAEAELRSGRGSRLAQILAGYPTIKDQGTSDFDPVEDTATTLVGILQRTEHHLSENKAIIAARDDINASYLQKFAIGSDVLRGEIGVSGDATLARALERLELRLFAGSKEWTRHGLGYSNALFMAAELLLLNNSELAPLLLIEEPEAHLHPQLQTRIMDLLRERAGEASDKPALPVQVICTTHSPNLASATPVEHLTLVSRGATFSLAPGQTRLHSDDYAFLSRFLDVTKANLFFARGVAIVEGDAEAIFLPALAKAVDRSFNECGVSIVNVGSVGLFRYSRIFQRDGAQIPVTVACIRDRDLVPAGTPQDMRGKLKCSAEMSAEQIEKHVTRLTAEDSGNVRTFVSDHWTLEYDLAAASWTMATLMHQAVRSAVASKNKWPTAERLAELDNEAQLEVQQWKDSGTSLADAAVDIYKPLRLDEASKTIAAQHAARLLQSTPVTDEELPPYLVAAFDYLCTPAA
ncbi:MULTISPECIES: AAA family ATPase [unclassified Streptomyces]|uniref:ATP-dependent nuclease n=1 Tax=unclassified Streptomyces TaxID=2593676 RepID=UPI00160FE853|nr:MULTISPECIES: AAA family ATPase [unclassified Streptomyces]MBB6421654.1 putative ATP-dependent endonuclease of OLD family [Streptomyces sp. AK010]MCF0086445.1 DNA replication and repair protein RecF [Streptomyces sp. MH192]MCF0098063.1 DNA replication and repair protein RecF [Streptomyces sp. MH191]